MSGDDEPKWESILYWFGWSALWLFAAVFTLMCLFGCMVYNWQG